MNSGTFHVMGQSWRYYSRERAIINSISLAQLPSGTAGDQVTIPVVPPTGTGVNFSVPKPTLPTISPYRGNVTWSKVINNVPPLWCVNYVGAIPSFQSGTYGNWSGVNYFDFTPNTDLRNFVGSYFLPMTGGVFVQQGNFSITTNQGNAGSVYDIDQDLYFAQKTFPLEYDANGIGGRDVPPNYANFYYHWKVTCYLGGDSWAGGTFFHDGGNAVAVLPSTITPVIPYLTWMGEHPTINRNINSDPPRGIFFRLGP